MEGFPEQKPLRILMTTDTVGGVWSYSIALCNALQSFQVHVYLVTTGAPVQPAQHEDVKRLKNVTVFETDFLLEWMASPWESIDASGEWLLQLEERLQPDLIHLNGYAYGSLGWKAPVVVVAHSDVWSWWLSVKGEWPPAGWNEYFERVRTGIQGADYLIAPSETMLNYVKEIYATATPGQVIYNGRESDTFYPAQKEPALFSMGRLWDEAKNIELLTKAAPLIHHPIRLAGEASFAGDSCTTEGRNITYLGKLPAQEVAAQLSAASVYVLPAKYEPFGLSVLEAALSGCALVLGNITSLKEIWNDCAVYVDTDDAVALADVINYLMENKEACLHYAQKAIERAATFTTTAMAENYIQVYRNMIKHKKQIAQQETI
jgi:glycogen(starch) synthase